MASTGILTLHCRAADATALFTLRTSVGSLSIRSVDIAGYPSKGGEPAMSPGPLFRWPFSAVLALGAIAFAGSLAQAHSTGRAIVGFRAGAWVERKLR